MHSNASNAGSPPNGGTRVTSSIGEPQREHNAQSRSTPLVGGCSISQSLFDGYVSQRTLRVSVPDQSRKEIHIEKSLDPRGRGHFCLSSSRALERNGNS